jgi:hypothetical protein
MAIKKFSTNAKVNSVQNSLFASGGDEVTTVGVYKYHVFTTVGSNAFTVLNGTKSVDVMMCGGGGSGGYRIGGGGGGGELKTYNSVSVSPGTYTVVVGHAGSASGVGLKNNGGMSKLLLGQTSLLTALGGGAGGSQSAGDGNIGGSGGGANEWQMSSGNGSRGAIASGTNTNAGGDGRGSPYAGGGGGGATSAGVSSTNLSGNGGGGGQGYLLTSIDSNFSSASINAFTGMTYISSGGGGGSYQHTGGTGGTGGGQGGGTSIVGQAATSFGSGGGGGGNDAFPQSGAGFKGLVIIRYTLN